MKNFSDVPAFHRRLHVRIGMVVLAVLVSMAAALLLFVQSQQQLACLEVTQRLNVGLARYIVDHQPRPLLTADGTPDADLLREMALDVMMINPAVEVYLLDVHGRILGHAIEGGQVPLRAVDLGPVHRLLKESDRVTFPLLGDDPRAPGHRNVFSVAVVGGQNGLPLAFLYVVLRGQVSQTLTQNRGRSDAMHQTAIAVLLASSLACAALLGSLAILTRPLRHLTVQLQGFRDEALEAGSVAVCGDEIAILEATTQAMQQRIAEQFLRLEHSDQIRRELVSNLSHDLQTPLSSIQGYVEVCLVRDQQLTAAEREHCLRVVLRHCVSLGRRIGNLFELSKLDSGHMRPHLEVFCLAELLQDVIQSYELQAQRRSITLSLSAASRSPACVRADIALMERVFQNLIDNALRHTPAGGTVSIDIQPDATNLRVRVTDTGAGIAQEHLARVFERYYRAEDTTTTEPGSSTGLGLAIVKRILELHGSAIRVRSVLAQGTCFDFNLPRALKGAGHA